MLSLKDQVEACRADGDLSIHVGMEMVSDKEAEEIQEAIDITAEDPKNDRYVHRRCNWLKPRCYWRPTKIEKRKLEFLEKRDRKSGQDGYDEDDVINDHLMKYTYRFHNVVNHDRTCLDRFPGNSPFG